MAFYVGVGSACFVGLLAFILLFCTDSLVRASKRRREQPPKIVVLTWDD